MRSRRPLLGVLIGVQAIAVILLLTSSGVPGLYAPVLTNAFTELFSVALLVASGISGCVIAWKRPADRSQKDDGGLESKLEKREADLREVHHRVKNNLQVLFSMTNIQKLKSQTDEAALAYVDCQNRIKAVGLIHEMLYQSADLTLIDLGQYLERLSGYIIYSYGLELLDFRIEVKGQGVRIPIQQAIPNAMIFVELLTNTVKHAVPVTPACRVRVELKDEDATIEVRYCDNGPGVPSDAAEGTEGSFGLKLIRGLVDQLEGRSEMQGEDGFCFELRFPSQS